MGYVKELDGLRGLMSFWVMLGHCLTTAAVPDSLGATKLFNGYAVDVFIMNSGFAICALLARRKESYRTYITRRIFRIFPVYLVMFFLSVLAAGWMLDSWAMAPDGYMREVRIGILERSMEEAPWHIALHLVGLHGLVPQDVLPAAEYAFLGQAWSISLEWQFYLVAPLVIWGFAAKKSVAGWMLTVLVFLVLLAFVPWMNAGYIGRALHFFGIGIGSFFLLKHQKKLVETFGLGTVTAGLVGLGVVAVPLLLTASLPIVIWVGTMLSIIHKTAGERGVFSLPAQVMMSPPLAWLGKVSYSVYLVHMLIIALVVRILAAMPGMGTGMETVLLFALTSALTLIASWASFRYVEQPFIALGKWVTGRQGTMPAPAPAR